MALPAAAAIEKLHHFDYRCRDAEETRQFYEDIIADATPIDTTDAPAPWWLCTRIGGIVPDVATPAPAEAPTLFDGAA